MKNKADRKAKFKAAALITATLALTLIFAGCPPSIRTHGGDEAIGAGIDRLRAAKGADVQAARADLEALAAKYEGSQLADNAILEVGKSYLAEEQYAEAAKRFQTVFEQYPQGDAKYEARYLFGLSLYRMGKLDESGSALSKVAPRDPHYVEASVLYIKVLLKEGNTVDAVSRYAKVRKLVRNPAQVKELDSAVREAVVGLPDEALEKLAREASDNPAGMLALFTLGERAYAMGNFRDAQTTLARFLAQYGDDPLADEARSILEEIEGIKKINKNAIGIILPLTGRWASFGVRYLYGAALALGAFHALPDSRFPYELYVMDSKSDPETARRAVEEMCTEKKVIAIIGPVQSEEAMAAGREAQACGVPIITLTQVEEVTKIGDMVFRNFVTPRDQARTLAWYAVTAMGIREFSTLYPNHAYGQLFNKVFGEEVAKQGGEIVLAQPYEPGQADFRQEIRNIATQKRKIQALFIPDTYYAAASIGPQLNFYNVIRIQLLGSSGWNSPKLIEYTQPQTSTIEGAIFTDGFFAASPEPYVRDFVMDFASNFGYEPQIYEATAYETARIVAAMISEQRVTDRLHMRNALANLSNFPSFSGYVQTQPDRSFRRPLFVLQVRQGKIVDISTTAHF